MVTAPTIPTIAPVSPGPRPQWTVAVPTHEPRAEHLRAALRSVLDQGMSTSDLELLVVDDGSAIDPRTLVEEDVAEQVRWIRREHAGLAATWNACVREARGHLVHLLHQDDLVQPGFNDALGSAAAQEPDGLLFACETIEIDRDGHHQRTMSPIAPRPAGVLHDWPEHLVVALAFQTPGVVVRRDAYERLGGFDEGYDYVCDWDMWVRIAAAGPVWWEPRPLACFRRHEGSTSMAGWRSGAFLREVEACLDAMARHLPPGIADDVLVRARTNATRNAVRDAWTGIARWRSVGLAHQYLQHAHRLTGWRGVAAMVQERVGERLRRGAEVDA